MQDHGSSIKMKQTSKRKLSGSLREMLVMIFLFAISVIFIGKDTMDLHVVHPITGGMQPSNIVANMYIQPGDNATNIHLSFPSLIQGDTIKVSKNELGFKDSFKTSGPPIFPSVAYDMDNTNMELEVRNDEIWKCIQLQTEYNNFSFFRQDKCSSPPAQHFSIDC